MIYPFNTLLLSCHITFVCQTLRLKNTKWLSITGFPSSTSGDSAVTSEASLLSNTLVTDIKEEIKFNTHGADPDSNWDMLSDNVENLSKKELNGEQSVTDKKIDSRSTAGDEQENLVPSIKENLKRVCKKKITARKKGEEVCYRYLH